MKFQVYSVFDSVSGVYDRIWQSISDGAALREFTDIACNADHPIGRHPEHYSLFRVAEFDDNTGELIVCEPKCIGRAHELVVASRQVDANQLDAFRRSVNASVAGRVGENRRN